MNLLIQQTWLANAAAPEDGLDGIPSMRCAQLEHAKTIAASFIRAHDETYPGFTDHTDIEQAARSEAPIDPVQPLHLELRDRNAELALSHFTSFEGYPSGQHAQNTENGEIGGSLSPTAGVALLPVDTPSPKVVVQDTNITGHQLSNVERNLLSRLPHDSSTEATSGSFSSTGELAIRSETEDANIASLEVCARDTFEMETRRIATSETPFASTETSPIPLPDLIPTPQHPQASLCGVPAEVLRFILRDLDDISKTCLKFTNSYFHASIKHKCARLSGASRQRELVACLERDIGTHRALLQCPDCEQFRLRKVIRGRSLGRRWMLSRLSWREERRSCCQTIVSPRSTALPIQQFGASSQELKSAERLLDIDNPGMALLLVCLHCSAEIPFMGEDIGSKWCPVCWCEACPLVFMPRHLSLSPVDG